MPIDLTYLIENVEKQKKALPPIDSWHPSVEKDIDIRIDMNGCWYHEGEVIKRMPLVKLFSSILREEAGEYYLVTPVEKCKITVEDTPFVVLNLVEPAGTPPFFVTQTDDVIPIDASFSSVLRTFKGMLLPYMMVRNNLLGRVSRQLYYELVNHPNAVVEDKKLSITINSQIIDLGYI